MYEQDGYVLEAAIGLLFTAVLLGWGSSPVRAAS
jgi:hypothetical protein